MALLRRNELRVPGYPRANLLAGLRTSMTLHLRRRICAPLDSGSVHDDAMWSTMWGR